MTRLLMLLIVVPALLGAGAAPPVRHLEYAFATYSTAKATTGLYNVTLSVDILGAAPDGGTVVRATESWYYTLRPRQTRECEVYASGTVRCDDAPPYPSESELVLFPLLASDFFNGASTGRSSLWQRRFELSVQKGLYVTAAALDLQATPQSDGRNLVVTSSGVFQQLGRHMQKALEDGRLLYDSTSRLPVEVHQVSSPMPTTSVYSETAVDLLLLQDSASPGVEPREQPRYQLNNLPPNGVPNVPLAAPLPQASGEP